MSCSRLLCFAHFDVFRSLSIDYPALDPLAHFGNLKQVRLSESEHKRFRLHFYEPLIELILRGPKCQTCDEKVASIIRQDVLQQPVAFDGY